MIDRSNDAGLKSEYAKQINYIEGDLGQNQRSNVIDTNGKIIAAILIMIICFFFYELSYKDSPILIILGLGFIIFSFSWLIKLFFGDKFLKWKYANQRKVDSR